MNKYLAALAAGALTVTLMSTPAKGETISLVDTIQDCLNESGTVKEEHLIMQYIWMNGGSFNKTYDCNGTRIIEQYPISEMPMMNPEGDVFIPITKKPIYISVGGIWYEDQNLDGINGNEKLSTETKLKNTPEKTKGFKIQYTPVGERGLNDTLIEANTTGGMKAAKAYRTDLDIFKAKGIIIDYIPNKFNKF